MLFILNIYAQVSDQKQLTLKRTWFLTFGQMRGRAEKLDNNSQIPVHVDMYYIFKTLIKKAMT